MKMSVLALLLAVPAMAAITPKMVDKIESMKWDGEDFTYEFSNYQRPIKISGKNPVVYCLENARLSSMEVLITVDTDIPMIKTCKLYSGSQVMTTPAQAQESKSE